MVNQTIDKLYSMKLKAMARGYGEQLSQPSYTNFSFEERLAMLVDQEYTHRENRKLERRLKTAQLKQQAMFEDIDFRHPRGLEKSVMLSLANCDWIVNHHNIVIVGPTGVGKSYLAESLANKACREGFSALLRRSTTLFRELETARGDGSYVKLLKKLKKTDVLILDDFLINPMTDNERRDFLEIMEDRYNVSSTILTSQYPITEWHALIGGPTLADAILDRIVHNSHKINLKGESMRKIKSNLTRKMQLNFHSNSKKDFFRIKINRY